MLQLSMNTWGNQWISKLWILMRSNGLLVEINGLLKKPMKSKINQWTLKDINEFRTNYVYTCCQRTARFDECAATDYQVTCHRQMCTGQLAACRCVDFSGCYRVALWGALGIRSLWRLRPWFSERVLNQIAYENQLIIGEINGFMRNQCICCEFQEFLQEANKCSSKFTNRWIP